MNDYRPSLRKIRASAVADEDGSVTQMPTHTLHADHFPYRRQTRAVNGSSSQETI